MEYEVAVHRSAQQDGEEEEKLNLYLNIVKTVAVKVQKSETARNLKAMLKDQEGIPQCFLEIFFRGNSFRMKK